ncbi:MAG: hypothetical protein QOE82_2650 [Thermoanaerobaculia bacterium]|nr:hypothetical protein [Thermoanaerobaculia bacterium]
MKRYCAVRHYADMRKTMIACLFVMLAVASSAYAECTTPLPIPDLKSAGNYKGAPGFFDVDVSVWNYAKYDNTLFVASPELPACGLNKKASRTWIEIYADTGVYIYGYCALSQNTQLQKLTFPWKNTTNLPKGFFIRIRDRKCNKVVQSNTFIFFPD